MQTLVKGNFNSYETGCLHETPKKVTRNSMSLHWT